MSKMSTNNRIAPGRVPFTRRKLVTAGAIAACASAVTASFVAAQPGPGTIHWSIDPNDSNAGKVQLTIDSRWEPGSHSTWSNDRSISELQGLSAPQLAGPRGPV